MNDLHKGVDYVEGFRYTDRYQNLISLLQVGSSYFLILIVVLFTDDSFL